MSPLASDPWPLVEALAWTRQTFVHSNWKLDNLGSDDRGRTVITACPSRSPAVAVSAPGGRRNLASVPDLRPEASPGWETALLVPVPTAEPAVREHRIRLDDAARDGVPAHITVLYPFLPLAGIGDQQLAALTELFGGFGGFQFTLDRVDWFGEELVWLGPSDPSPFTALTNLAFAGYPSCPPYGGVHAEVIPHLTVGHGDQPQVLRSAAESVSRALPIHATATEVILMTGPRPGTPGTPPGQWRTITAFPLGQRPAVQQHR